MSWEEFWLKLAIALIPFVAAPLGLLFAMGVRWLQSKTKNADRIAMLERFSTSARTIAKSLMQGVVGDLKEASEDGKLSKEERDQLAADFWTQFKAYWGPTGIAELKYVLGYKTDDELRVAADHEREAAVYDLKEEQLAVDAMAMAGTEVEVTEDEEKN